jgi:hypothetical protein
MLAELDEPVAAAVRHRTSLKPGQHVPIELLETIAETLDTALPKPMTDDSALNELDA